MRVFGEVIAEARRKANLTQRQLAALIKTEEGRGISGPYLNDIEHSLRHPPRGAHFHRARAAGGPAVAMRCLWITRPNCPPPVENDLRSRRWRGILRGRNPRLTTSRQADATGEMAVAGMTAWPVTRIPARKARR